MLERLEKDNGFVVRKATNFDRYYAVDREMLFKFLNDTQSDTMEYLRKIYKGNLEETIVSFINAETTKTRGSLIEVLKHGIELSNQKIELTGTVCRGFESLQTRFCYMACCGGQDRRRTRKAPASV